MRTLRQDITQGNLIRGKKHKKAYIILAVWKSEYTESRRSGWAYKKRMRER